MQLVLAVLGVQVCVADLPYCEHSSPNVSYDMGIEVGAVGSAVQKLEYCLPHCIKAAVVQLLPSEDHLLLDDG